MRFATDTTRATTLGLLVELLAMLGGAPTEVLSDRDPALVIRATPDGRAVFVPEWLDLAGVLGITPKACRPYRAQTKGKVERVIRELKQDFLAWLTGQALPPGRLCDLPAQMRCSNCSRAPWNAAAAASARCSLSCLATRARSRSRVVISSRCWRAAICQDRRRYW